MVKISRVKFKYIFLLLKKTRKKSVNAYMHFKTTNNPPR